MSHLINHYKGTIGQQGSQGTTSNIPFTTSNNTIIYNTTVSNYNFVIPNYTNTYVTGTEYKLLFDVNKGAFRVGGITTSVWNNINLGNDSFASGFNNLASGTNSSIIAGLNNNVNSLNSSILMSNTSTINNSNNSSIIGGLNNLIINSTNSHIMGSNCTVSNSSYSVAMGNSSTITHSNAFVWSDSTSRNSIGNNTVLFGCANGFVIDLGNNYGITVTNNGLIPFTDNNTNFGSATNKFTNLYLANGLYSNNLQLNDTTQSVMNYNGIINTPFNIVPNVSSLTLGSSSVGFGNLNIIGSVYANNVQILKSTTNQLITYKNIIPSSTFTLGSTSNLFGILSANTLNCFDSIVVRRTTGGAIALGDPAGFVSYDTFEFSNVRSPANITYTLNTTKFMNTSGRTARWHVAYESRIYVSGSLSNLTQLEMGINTYNTSNTAIRINDAHCYINTNGIPDVVPNSNCIVELQNGYYIQIYVRAFVGSASYGAGSENSTPWNTTRAYITEI